jgi:hypothetical protein
MNVLEAELKLLVYIFMSHHTGEGKLTPYEICGACYEAGRLLGRHNSPKNHIFEKDSNGWAHQCPDCESFFIGSKYQKLCKACQNEEIDLKETMEKADA